MTKHKELKIWFQETFKKDFLNRNRMVDKMIETYKTDQLRDVKETLKLDGKRLAYRLNGENYTNSNKKDQVVAGLNAVHSEKETNTKFKGKLKGGFEDMALKFHGKIIDTGIAKSVVEDKKESIKNKVQIFKNEAELCISRAKIGKGR